ARPRLAPSHHSAEPTLPRTEPTDSVRRLSSARTDRGDCVGSGQWRVALRRRELVRLRRHERPRRAVVRAGPIVLLVGVCQDSDGPTTLDRVGAIRGGGETRLAARRGTPSRNERLVWTARRGGP